MCSLFCMTEQACLGFVQVVDEQNACKYITANLPAGGVFVTVSESMGGVNMYTKEKQDIILGKQCSQVMSQYLN